MLDDFADHLALITPILLVMARWENSSGLCWETPTRPKFLRYLHCSRWYFTSIPMIGKFISPPPSYDIQKNIHTWNYHRPVRVVADPSVFKTSFDTPTAPTMGVSKNEVCRPVYPQFMLNGENSGFQSSDWCFFMFYSTVSDPNHLMQCSGGTPGRRASVPVGPWSEATDDSLGFVLGLAPR